VNMVCEIETRSEDEEMKIPLRNQVGDLHPIELRVMQGKRSKKPDGRAFVDAVLEDLAKLGSVIQNLVWCCEFRYFEVTGGVGWCGSRSWK